MVERAYQYNHKHQFKCTFDTFAHCKGTIRYVYIDVCLLSMYIVHKNLHSGGKWSAHCHTESMCMC